MHIWSDTLIVLLILTNLWLLGSSRLNACIRIVAVQGIVLGLLALTANIHDLTPRVVIQLAFSTTLKSVIFPWLLMRAVREAHVRREVEPYVGPTLSLLAGIALLGLSLWIGSRLRLPGPMQASLGTPAAFFTILVGFFLVVSRKTAVSQVLGYLALENGIYTFGMAFAESQPLLVEMGILLDIFVAVFVMGITIYQINREFDHIDTDRLSILKDGQSARTFRTIK
jgi:hydrogenase-4 component E